jgi:hypothetical protein
MFKVKHQRNLRAQKFKLKASGEESKENRDLKFLEMK